MHPEFRQSPREFAIRVLAGNGRAAVVRFLVPIPLSLGLCLGLSLTSSPENPGRAELRLRQLRLRNLVSHVTSNDISDPNRLSTVACAKCHGQLLNPEKSQHHWQNAYQVWVSQDPHSDAYVSLWNRQSQRIVAALTRAAGKTQSTTGNAVLSDALYQQTINECCVSCHSTVPAAMSVEMNLNQKDSADNLSMANGVGCLSCHSTTELDNPEGKDWIEAHTKKPWADYSTKEKTRLGLQDLTRHEVRAQTCIKCHLGSPGRDVDHDLVAAGHPRLAFEYASHLLRLPKHWEEEKTDHFYTTCWSIGQLESAKGALTLLKHRAKLAAQGKAAWPEFTEYNCSSCHHGLAHPGIFPTIRQALANRVGAPGPSRRTPQSMPLKAISTRYVPRWNSHNRIRQQSFKRPRRLCLLCDTRLPSIIYLSTFNASLDSAQTKSGLGTWPLTVVFRIRYWSELPEKLWLNGCWNLKPC